MVCVSSFERVNVVGVDDVVPAGRCLHQQHRQLLALRQRLPPELLQLVQSDRHRPLPAAVLEIHQHVAVDRVPLHPAERTAHRLTAGQPVSLALLQPIVPSLVRWRHPSPRPRCAVPAAAPRRCCRPLAGRPSPRCPPARPSASVPTPSLAACQPVAPGTSRSSPRSGASPTRSSSRSCPAWCCRTGGGG